MLHPKTKPYSTSKTTLERHDYAYKILIATDICHIPGLILGMFTIFTHTGLILSDFVHSHSPCSATLLALTVAFQHLTQKKFVRFFFTDGSFFSYYNMDDKSNLTATVTPFLHTVEDYLTSSPSCMISGFWYDQKWPWLGCINWLSQLQDQAAHKFLGNSKLVPSKDRIFDKWNTSPPPPFHPRHHYLPFHDPACPSLHPFTKGCLITKSRRYQSALFQTITGHGFHTDYSDRFRPTAGNTTKCPHCGNCYTVDHILFHCPTHTHHRHTLSFDSQSQPLVFFLLTKVGAECLGMYIHLTQELLKPLPPWSDPP